MTWSESGQGYLLTALILISTTLLSEGHVTPVISQFLEIPMATWSHFLAFFFLFKSNLAPIKLIVRVSKITGVC